MPAATFNGPAGRLNTVPLVERRNCSKPAIFSVRLLLSAMLLSTWAEVPLPDPTVQRSRALAVVSGRFRGVIVVLATAAWVVEPPVLLVPFNARYVELRFAAPPTLRW